MNIEKINENGLVLVGCGKMGGAMLSGWLVSGISPQSVWVMERAPLPALSEKGVHINADFPLIPAVVLLAVKPQMMAEVLPQVQHWGNGKTLFISVAAGVPMAAYENALGAKTPIIRTMPNTPAAIGQGVTALYGNAAVCDVQMALAEALMAAIGTTVRLESEAQMDAVTAVSGSGPAYVFHMIETLAAAGVAEGLSPALALQLAQATVAGAGALAAQSDEDPGQLRVNVTSPNGTTQAALEVLMDDEVGLPPLMRRAVEAAAARSRELANGG